MKITRILGAAVFAAGLVVYAAKTAFADIRWLPKYQEQISYSDSRVSDGTRGSADPLSCESKGWLSSAPANQSCQPKYMPGGKKCWADCQCSSQYKYKPGKGVSGGCPNGQTVSGESCGGLYESCEDCSTNTQVPAGWSTTKKSGTNVAVMKNFGTCADYYYSCNTGYKPATAVGNAYLSSGPYNWILCTSRQKAVNQDGSTSTPKLCQKCVTKTCSDYNEDYVSILDPNKDCTKIDSSKVGGLNCWQCAACGTMYKYTKENCPAPKILGSDTCGGKASTCTCPATVTCNNTTCKTPAPSGCSGCLECNPCPNLGKYTAAQCKSIGGQARSSNYEACSDKYTCCGGTRGSCPAGYICSNSSMICPGEYIITGIDCTPVTVNEAEEVCTKWCEADSSMCIEKRKRTCSELLAANNCRRYNSGSTISGTISNDICIFGNVTQSGSLTFNPITVWDPGKRWSVCQREVSGTPKLDLGTITINSHVTFRTDVDIDYVTFMPSKYWSADFYGDSKIHVDFDPGTAYGGAVELHFVGEMIGTSTSYNKTTNQVSVTCSPRSGSSSITTRCDVNIYNQGADVTYCGQVNYSYCGSCRAEVGFRCGTGAPSSGTCTNRGGACPTRW